MAGQGASDELAAERTLDGRWAVAALGAVVVAMVAYFALGMPGMEHGGSSTGGAMEHAAMAVSVDDFAQRVASSGALVINVHVPDEGRIAGTDLAVPYDSIVGDRRLPRDKSTPMLLYCKTGSMSGEAAVALMNAGYTDVRYLDGGMEAWVAAGRPLR